MNCFYCNKPNAQIETEEYECNYCNGTGDDPDMCGAPFCPYCSGDGYEEEIWAFCDDYCVQMYFEEMNL